MIICKLQGGLGNQLFQYAFAKAKSIEMCLPVKFDISFYQKKLPKHVTQRSLDIVELIGDIEIAGQDDYRKVFGPFAQQKYKLAKLFAKFNIRILPKFFFESNHFQYSPTFENNTKPTYFEGYWQHYKYFESYDETIFKSLYKLLDSTQPLVKENVLAVHFRRGDYISNSYHPILPLDYYSQALEKISEKLLIMPDIHVFSDDINWCKDALKSLKGFENAVFVENGYHMDQFKRMASCTHFIIANSTFSWWAAWLAKHKMGVVIAPSEWVNNQNFNSFNFFPNNWIIM